LKQGLASGDGEGADPAGDGGEAADPAGDRGREGAGSRQRRRRKEGGPVGRYLFQLPDQEQYPFGPLLVDHLLYIPISNTVNTYS
jgi:hypothetical protein